MRASFASAVTAMVEATSSAAKASWALFSTFSVGLECSTGYSNRAFTSRKRSELRSSHMYDVNDYGRMMADPRRMKAYTEALRRAVKPG